MDEYEKFMMGLFAQTSEFARQFPTHCLCPGCMDAPIKSHSQQYRGALSAIAKHNKVIVPSRDSQGMVRRLMEGRPPSGRLHAIEIKRATTFKGFCAKHDTELFRAIETRPLEKGDEEQVLAFHRRAVAFEVMNKFQMIVELNAQGEALKYYGMLPDDWDENLNIQKILFRADLDYDWNPLWVDRPLNSIDYAWRIIPKKILVSMASSISAFHEEQIVEYTDRHIDLKANRMDCPRPGFTLTIVPQEKETHVIMVWSRRNAPLIELLRERMLSEDEGIFETFLNECVFCKSEDYCIGPAEWDMVSPAVRRIVENDLPTDNLRAEEQIVPRIIRL